MSSACVACRHQIDESAKLCPYCGADPHTGQKVDTQAIMQEIFQPKHLTRAEGVMQFARQRQGVVVIMAIVVALLLLTALHQFAIRRNETDVSAANAVPLTEITDLTSQSNESRPQPMPPLQFQFDGRPQTMRAFVVEQGAVPPANATPAPATPQTPAK